MRVLVTNCVLILGLLVSTQGCYQSVADSAVALDELHEMLEAEQQPVLLDVRLASDFDEAPQVISSAKWRDPDLVDEWGLELPKDREIVVYCAHGYLVSRRAAARLQELGFDARILDGGIEAWKESGRDVVPARRE